MQDFGRLLVAEIPALRRYALALLRDPARADDLVQDCLERAVSRSGLWQGRGSLRAWLFTMMHNLYANQLRDAARRPRAVALERAAEPASEARQVRDLEARQLLETFARLSEEHRQVLLLVAVEGLSYREAAEVLEVPLGTVMSRLARGRERLREMAEERKTGASAP